MTKEEIAVTRAVMAQMEAVRDLLLALPEEWCEQNEALVLRLADSVEPTTAAFKAMAGLK